MAVTVFMMEEIHLTCRGATAYLYAHSQTLAKLGLDKELAIQAISHNTDMISREEIEGGNLTKDMLKAMTVT